MDTPEIISATEASRSFSEFLHRVCYGGESFIIKKGNRLMARIVPVEQVDTQVAAVPVITVDEPLPDGVTEADAEYFQTILAQMRGELVE